MTAVCAYLCVRPEIYLFIGLLEQVAWKFICLAELSIIHHVLICMWTKISSKPIWRNLFQPTMWQFIRLFMCII